MPQGCEGLEGADEPWWDKIALVFGLTGSRTMSSLVLDKVTLPKKDPVCNLEILLNSRSKWQSWLGGPFYFIYIVHQLCLDWQTLLTDIHTLATYSLNYCNTLYMELLLKNIQPSSGTECRSTDCFHSSRTTHIILLFCKLHWLPVCF